MTQRIALIFGISGQTGAYLAHLLLNKGYVVVGTSRNNRTNKFGNLVRLGIKDRMKLLSASLVDPSEVLRILHEVEPDEVYNLASQSSVALSYEQPVETFNSIAVATVNILECLRQTGRAIHFFNAVSTDCFGHTLEPATEVTAFQPRSPYAMAKTSSYWAAISYRDAYGLHVSNGILSNHESPLRPERFVTQRILRAVMRIAQGSRERLSLGNLDVRRDWGWAPDFAEAIWKITRHNTPSDFIVATGTSSSLQDFVRTSFAEVGLNAADHIDIDRNLFRPTDLPSVLVSPERIAAVVGWRACVRMPHLVKALIEAETTKTLGPVPWSEENPIDNFPPPRDSQ